MCNKELHIKPQGRDDSNSLLQYGQVKLILKPLYLTVYTSSIASTFDLCEGCRHIIEQFVKYVATTKRRIEDKELTIKQFLSSSKGFRAKFRTGYGISNVAEKALAFYYLLTLSAAT